MPLIATTQSTVSDLLRNFAEACRALVPSLDRASVRWADGQHYDNWDRIAEALSESLVLEPCRFHVAAVFPSAVLKLERYGFMPAGANAFVSLNRNPAGKTTALFNSSREKTHSTRAKVGQAITS